MTTQTIDTTIANIPSPFNWAHPTTHQEPEILFLEKATDGRVTLEDISGALDEYKRLFKAGIASPAEVLTLTRAYPDNAVYAKELRKIDMTQDDEAMVIGGPASIELVDREGHLITTEALDKAFIKYMKNFRTRNAMVLHSDVQVGWALPAYISKGGQIFKSGVDDKGLFFITELRNDTKISEKVMEQIKEGKLKSYSIAGSAVKTQNIQKGMQTVMQVDELELAEVTVCEKGVNQGAAFDILKAEGVPTGSCIDGSCLISKGEDCDCGCNDSQGVELMFKSDGDIDFTKSFLQYVKKEELTGESFPTLMNTQGRQAEHHRLLDQYGFPSEIEPENARYTPVIELDLAHQRPPWVVNEAGQNLGERHYEDALTVPKLGAVIQRGVDEGSNSTETPVSQLTTTDAFNAIITKAKIEKGVPAVAAGIAGAALLAPGMAVASLLPKSNKKSVEKSEPIQKIGPLMAAGLGAMAGGVLGKKKSVKKAEPIQKLGPLAAAGLGALGGSLLGGKKKAVKKAEPIQKIGPLAAGLMGVAAGAIGSQILGSRKESSKKLKKSDDFFNWMAQQANHMYKSDCPCESCFQKTADYKGTIEKPFLA